MLKVQKMVYGHRYEIFSAAKISKIGFRNLTAGSYKKLAIS